MKIAVPYQDGAIHEDFDSCTLFAVYYTDEEGKEVVMKKLVEITHDAVEVLAGLGVRAVVCCDVSGESRKGLEGYGISVHDLFQGEADVAADVLVAGGLDSIAAEGGCGGCGGGCCGAEGSCCGGEDHDHGSCGCGCPEK